MPVPDLEFLDSISNALDLGIVILDAQTRVRGWNAWFYAASQISADAALGKLLSDVFPAAKSPRLNSAIEAALGSGVSSLLTHALHRTLFPLKTTAGLTMVHDVSVRAMGPKGDRICLLQIIDVTVAYQRETVYATVTPPAMTRWSRPRTESTRWKNSSASPRKWKRLDS